MRIIFVREARLKYLNKAKCYTIPPKQQHSSHNSSAHALLLQREWNHSRTFTLMDIKTLEHTYKKVCVCVCVCVCACMMSCILLLFCVCVLQKSVCASVCACIMWCVYASCVVVCVRVCVCVSECVHMRACVFLTKRCVLKHISWVVVCACACVCMCVCVWWADYICLTQCASVALVHSSCKCC